MKRDESIASIAKWLGEGARRNPLFTQTFDEFAWRLIAANIPVLRVTLHTGTLHPQFLGATYMWWRDVGQTQKVMIAHAIADLVPYADNPVRRVREGGETLRRRLAGPDARLDFSVLHDLKARGGTEYFALPVGSPFGFGDYMMSYLADRPDGFTNRELEDLKTLSASLSVIADMNNQRQIAENVLRAYLGPQTGPRVLAGQIRRGSGESIAAVIWSSDLRGFTALSDRLPGERVIAILNDLFDLQAKAIAEHGGEILKFVGDGLLAIFPAADPADAARAARSALAAAQTTLAELRKTIQLADERAPRIVIALHYGTVIYGNIGSADRLDFTVIGPAVNLTALIESMVLNLGRSLLLSADFVGAGGIAAQSLGVFPRKGIGVEREIFAPFPVG